MNGGSALSVQPSEEYTLDNNKQSKAENEKKQYIKVSIVHGREKRLDKNILYLSPSVQTSMNNNSNNNSHNNNNNSQNSSRISNSSSQSTNPNNELAIRRRQKSQIRLVSKFLSSKQGRDKLLASLQYGCTALVFLLNPYSSGPTKTLNKWFRLRLTMKSSIFMKKLLKTIIYLLRALRLRIIWSQLRLFLQHVKTARRVLKLGKGVFEFKKLLAIILYGQAFPLHPSIPATPSTQGKVGTSLTTIVELEEEDKVNNKFSNEKANELSNNEKTAVPKLTVTSSRLSSISQSESSVKLWMSSQDLTSLVSESNGFTRIESENETKKTNNNSNIYENNNDSNDNNDNNDNYLNSIEDNGAGTEANSYRSKIPVNRKLVFSKVTENNFKSSSLINPDSLPLPSSSSSSASSASSSASSSALSSSSTSSLSSIQKKDTKPTSGLLRALVRKLLRALKRLGQFDFLTVSKRLQVVSCLFMISSTVVDDAAFLSKLGILAPNISTVLQPFSKPLVICLLGSGAVSALVDLLRVNIYQVSQSLSVAPASVQLSPSPSRSSLSSKNQNNSIYNNGHKNNINNNNGHNNNNNNNNNNNSQQIMALNNRFESTRTASQFAQSWLQERLTYRKKIMFLLFCKQLIDLFKTLHQKTTKFGSKKAVVTLASSSSSSSKSKFPISIPLVVVSNVLSFLLSFYSKSSSSSFAAAAKH